MHAPSLRSTLLLALVLAVAVAAPANAAGPPAGPGGAAHPCKDGGWRALLTAEGERFANQGRCVAYAAREGTLVPLRAAACTDRLETLFRQDGTRFADLGACLAYVADGGELIRFALEITRDDGETIGFRITGAGLGEIPAFVRRGFATGEVTLPSAWPVGTDGTLDVRATVPCADPESGERTRYLVALGFAPFDASGDAATVEARAATPVCAAA